MLTQNEKQGFEEILQTFSEDDIIALKDTVTNRLVATRNKREAITAILTYTVTAPQLLKRKKLRRDAIFQYLDRHRVAILPNADKNRLIRTVLAHWGSNVNQEDNGYVADGGVEVDDSDDDDVDNIQLAPPLGLQRPPQYVPQREPQRVPQRVPQREPQHEPQRVPQHEPQHVPQRVPLALALERQAAGDGGVLIDGNHQNNTAAEGATTTTPSIAQQLAKQFVTWFFQQLNSLNPQFAKNGADAEPPDWGPHHFFDDCKLKLKIQSPLDSRMDQYDGAEIVAERFRSLVLAEGLLFNPNVEDDGTKGVTEPHGLVMVIVCGTIHRQGSCMGVFEQRFGLVRDILNANNWKIKFTDMNVKGEPVNEMPSLGGASNFPAITQ